MNTKTSTICDKWKFAVDGALRRLKSSSVRMEWKRFSLEQIEFLKDLLESNGQEAKLTAWISVIWPGFVSIFVVFMCIVFMW